MENNRLSRRTSASPVAVVPGRLDRGHLPAPEARRNPGEWLPSDPIPGAWKPLLEYHAELHRRSTHGPLPPLERDWIEIGPGYVGGPCFGHWDCMHAALDALPGEPAFTRRQILNQIEQQAPSGAIPGVLAWDASGAPFLLGGLAPGCWPMVLDDWLRRHGPDPALQQTGLTALARLLAYMERERSVVGGGFFFADARDRVWESGIDEGVRFDPDLMGDETVFACVDATAQTALHYRLASEWASALGEDATHYRKRYRQTADFLEESCRDSDTGWFHDTPMVGRPERRVLSFEGIWALWVRGLSGHRADREIDGILLSEKGLLGAHGLLTVDRREPRFEPRLWRGPSWNSMTYWAARSCLACDRPDAARILLRRALDGAAAVFEQTGTVWEFYSPDGEDPRTLRRKPGAEPDHPCPDYLGHNPFFAMAELWLRLADG